MLRIRAYHQQIVSTPDRVQLQEIDVDRTFVLGLVSTDKTTVTVSMPHQLNGGDTLYVSDNGMRLPENPQARPKAAPIAPAKDAAVAGGSAGASIAAIAAGIVWLVAPPFGMWWTATGVAAGGAVGTTQYQHSANARAERERMHTEIGVEIARRRDGRGPTGEDADAPRE